MLMTDLISVVVTTYNRADLLEGCLGSLVNQTLDTNRYEVIVVDNNSTDNTEQVVESFRDAGNVTYCNESQQGMNHARNLGLLRARGEYVAYIDDDARAALDWLEVACRAFAAIKPIPDCLGGPIFPFYTSPKPEWFKDEYEIRRDWDAPRYLDSGNSFSGSNMVWRKELLVSIGGFDPDFGVVGSTLRLGGETIVFDKAWSVKQDLQLYYTPKLVVHHCVPRHKMTVSYRLKRKFAEGQYEARQRVDETLTSDVRRIGRLLFYLAKAYARLLLRSGSYTSWQNWIVEGGSSIAFCLGSLLGLLGIQPDVSQGKQ
jgi:glycosyltransferase involved in cell wall biosynthesis